MPKSSLQDVIVDPVDYSRPLNMKSLTMLSRGIDFAKFHDTFAINDMQAIADQVQWHLSHIRT